VTAVTLRPYSYFGQQPMAHVQHIMPDNGKNSWISLSLSAHWNTHIQERNVPCSKQLKLYQLWESINYHRQEIILFLSITEKKQTKIVYSDAIEVFCVSILGDLKADMQLKRLCNTKIKNTVKTEILWNFTI